MNILELMKTDKVTKVNDTSKNKKKRGGVSHCESTTGNVGLVVDDQDNKKKPDGVQGKHWKVNYHLKDDESFESIFERLKLFVDECNLAEWAFGEEYGKSGKTRHIEGGFITRQDRKRRTAILALFPFCYCKKSRQSRNERNAWYATKEGNRHFCSENWAPPEKVEVIEKLRSYQELIWNYAMTPPVARQILWVYGDFNIGKSEILLKLVVEQKAYVLPTRIQCALSQIYKSHHDHNIYCMNLTGDESFKQTKGMFSVMEKLKDRFFSAAFGTECNGMCFFNHKTLIVTANAPPDFSKTNIDKNRFLVYRVLDDYEVCQENLVYEFIDDESD